VLASGLPPEPASMFALRSAHAEALALIGRHDEGDREFAALLDHTLEPSELGRLVARRLDILASQDRHADALTLGLATLRRLGLALRPSRATLMLAALRAWRGIRKLGRERLLALPDVRDARIAAQLLIADAMQTSAFLIQRELSVELNAVQMLLVVRHGFHPIAPRTLGQFGILLVVLGRPLEAAQLAEWALELAKRGPSELRPRVETSARLFVWPHSRPIVGSLRGLEDLYERALAAGDRDTAGYVGGLGLRGLIESGAPLRELAARAKRLHDGLIGWATRDQRALIGNSRLLIEALVEGVPSEQFDRFLAGVGEIGEVIRYGAATTLALGDWLLGRRAAALARIEPLAANFAAVTIGTWLFGRFALLRAVASVSAVERGELSARGLSRWLRDYRKRLRRSAALVPANFAAPLHIVTAELHRLRGEHDLALTHYELARSEAEQHGQLYAAGVALERLGELSAQLAQPLTRAGALRLARDVYLRWGASAVVTRLEHDHGDLFATRDHETSTVTPTKHDDPWVPDSHATLALMQALGEELNLEQVITRVLAAAIEHAGADRGVLVLEREGVPGIVAEGGVGSVSEYLDAPVPLAEAGDRVPRRIVDQVLRSGRAVIFDEFDHDPELGRDPYFVSHAVPSLLCLPIVKLHRRVGALLLEHESPMQEFTFERLEILRSFASQAASALDNARLYEALQRSEAQWRSLVGGVPDVITVVDEQGRFEFTNHVGGFPIDPQSVLGTPAEAIIGPAQQASWREAQQAVRAGQGPRELECQIAPPGFARRWYLVRLAGIEVGGKVGRIITIATDIEERKRDESDRARLEAQLRQQQRLESLGTLASGVAHEINNPIQGIMNYAELVRGRPDDRAMVEEFAAEISHESRRVTTIVRNLMAFSRQEREQQQLERIEVATLIENTLTLIRAVLRKDRIDLQLELDEGLPPLSCRAAQIQQILMNLVTNARDALNERAVGAERRTLVLRANSWIREGRPWLRISVADRGGGIDEAVLGRIFDPFFTTKGRDQGTGLGLAVSHGIALEHGGLLWVDNEPGVGATFHLDLPALQ
jgi:signal transduction histidine kinase